MLITPRSDNHVRHELNPKQLNVRDATLLSCIKSLIQYYLVETTATKSETANFSETPARALKAWLTVHEFEDMDSDQFLIAAQTLTKTYMEAIIQKKDVAQKLTEILETGFPLEQEEGHPKSECGIIAQGPIQAAGYCPHHLLPVMYEIFVAYKPKPGGTVLGLSKLARTAQLLTLRPVLQEQVSTDIADALFFAAATNERPDLPQIETDGSAVQVIGSHQCMSCRGVNSDALTLTTTLRGAFQKDALKEEFYQAIESIRRSELFGMGDDDEPDFGEDPEEGDEDEEGNEEDEGAPE